MIVHIQLVFNTAVPANSIIVTKLAGYYGASSNTQVTVTTTSTTLTTGVQYTLSFSGQGVDAGNSLEDGVYSLQLHTSSGTTTLATFFRLFGDTNGDGRVDSVDLAVLQAAVGHRVGQTGYVAYLSYESNGTVGAIDEQEFGWVAGTNTWEGQGRYGYMLDTNSADANYGLIVAIPDFTYADGTTPPARSRG